MDRFDPIIEPLRVFLAQVGDFLPRLALAVIILFAGWLLAKAVRFAIERGLRAVNFHVVTERSGIDTFLREGGVSGDFTDLLAVLFYWIVILAALVMGFNLLGLSYITDLLSEVLRFVPKLLVALLIIAFGAYFAKFIGGVVTAYCRNISLQDAELLGGVTRYALLTFVVLVALDQINVGGDIVRQTFLILLAGVVFALALAFGLGARDWAADLLERWWPRKKP